MSAAGSSPPPKWEPTARWERRYREAHDAAASAFAENGYLGASTKDIADRLGILQGSLYYYFPSKEVALELVCIHGVAGFFETAQAIAGGPGQPSERLAGLIRAHIAPVLDRLHFVRVFLNQRQFLPNRSRRRVGKLSRGLEKIFEDVIRQGMRAGEFRADLDPRVTTLGILGMANGVAAWYGKEDASIERIGSDFVRLVLAGIASGEAGRGRPKANR
jgi:AcrR family transcriptional regulator